MAIHIGRREFVVTLGSVAAWSLTVRAQVFAHAGLNAARQQMIASGNTFEAVPDQPEVLP